MSAITSKEEGMSEDDLKAIEARAASGGREVCRCEHAQADHVGMTGVCQRSCICREYRMNRWQTGDEFRGAAARQDVPTLLAEVRRLRAALNRAADHLEAEGHPQTGREGMAYAVVRAALAGTAFA